MLVKTKQVRLFLYIIVRYESQYDALVRKIHASNSYQNASKEERQETDGWLRRDDVKKYFGSRIVPQLTLHESFVLGFANSEALQQRTPEEQEKVMKHVNSASFKKVVDDLEGRMQNLLRV